MNIRNTLRRFGGVDIKLKADRKSKRLLITVLVIIGGFFVCKGLYILFDRVMNGFLVDWFENNYVNREWVSLGENSFYQKSIRWNSVKGLALRSLIILVTLWILSVRMISVLYASWREKKLLHDMGRMIGDFMRHDREASEVFPNEYAEVSVQMAEIKAAMQRNEQILKEEAGKKNDLITYLAHDLKTPLTSVIGYLSLLEEAPDMPAEQKAKYVNITLDKALRLEKLINEFFEITRFNLQQIVLEKESVDLSFMLVQMTDEFYPILSAHGNTMKLELPPECANSLVLYADREKLARVFNNILKNAVAYSYPNTEICVGCEEMGDSVRITFSNRGKTIPRHKLDSIFEKFFRLDDARTTNTGGAGLGLAIAREIVTFHGGAITADSADEVTTFTVVLPR